MKIAQIVPSLESRHGGPSRSVLGLASGLARTGRAVELLSTAPDGNGTAQTEGALVTRIFPREWPQAVCPSAPLRQHLLAGDYGTIHHHGLWLRTLHYAHKTAARKNVPLVISPRGMMSPWAWNHRRSKKALAERIIHPGAFSAAAGWHVTSEAELQDIRRLGFNQPVCVAPNGVTAPDSAQEAEAAAHWREAHPILTRHRVALFYSRFHAKKRVLELIDLWLSAPRGDWILFLVGIPEAYTVAQLEAYVIRQGGTGKVVVEDGTDAPLPYAASSLFLLPSHSENFGLVVAEALARGLPVIATDSTPWQRLESVGAGRCVSWQDYPAALQSLLSESPESLAERGCRGVDWTLEEFSWIKTARLLEAFYGELRSAAR